ncbi:MAG: hypothetical protein ACK596_13940, partial [Pseudanabaena sp.]
MTAKCKYFLNLLKSLKLKSNSYIAILIGLRESAPLWGALSLKIYKIRKINRGAINLKTINEMRENRYDKAAICNNTAS